MLSVNEFTAAAHIKRFELASGRLSQAGSVNSGGRLGQRAWIFACLRRIY